MSATASRSTWSRGGILRYDVVEHGPEMATPLKHQIAHASSNLTADLVFLVGHGSGHTSGTLRCYAVEKLSVKLEHDQKSLKRVVSQFRRPRLVGTQFIEIGLDVAFEHGQRQLVLVTKVIEEAGLGDTDFRNQFVN